MRLNSFHWRITEDGKGKWLEDDGGPGSYVPTVYAYYQLRGCMEKTIIIDLRSQTSLGIGSEISQAMSNEGYPAETVSLVIETLKHPRRPYQETDAVQICTSPPKKISQTRCSSISSIFPVSPRDSLSLFEFVQRDPSVKISVCSDTDMSSLPNGPGLQTETAPSVEVLTILDIDVPVFILVKLAKNACVDMDGSPEYLFILAGPGRREMSTCLVSLLRHPNFEEVIRSGTDRKSLLLAVDDCLKRASIMSPCFGSEKSIELQIRRKKNLAGSSSRSDSDHSSRNRKSSYNSEKSAKSVHYTELQRRGHFFGGLIQDLRLRIPLYLDDIRDAFHFHCLMSVVFIFFITCASAVAFGELIEAKTHGLIGVSEMLAAHAICNIVWGLIAGQPLCIQAGVGLLLAFEGSLYTFCENFEVDFLSMRVWTGVWVVVLMLVITMFEGACLVRYLTRFTEEISTCLIAFFFLYEAALFFLEEFAKNPIRTLFDYCFNFNSTKESKVRGSSSAVIQMDGGFTWIKVNGTEYIVASMRDPGEIMKPPPGTSTPDTALLTLILALLTFGLVHWLTQMRKSKYFGRTMRKVISDLAVPIVLLLVTLLDQFAFKDTQTKHLDLPGSVNNHKWLVSPMGNGDKVMPTWAILASFIPAVSVCILVFAEVELAEMQLSIPERLLKRPQGFHWDLLVCGFLILVCSLLGLPWMCTAIVQTMAHVNSLTVSTRSMPEGVKRPTHVLEQRVTCIAVGILHGTSVFGGAALNLIPVAALFGIFIFLGVAGLSDLQLTQRLSLILIPPKHFPRIPYCTQISVWRLHLFTVIQVVCVGGLCVLKVLPPASFLFPVALAGVSLFRQFLLPKLYSSTQLEAIDGQEEEAVRDDDEEQEETMGDETDTYPHDRAFRF